MTNPESDAIVGIDETGPQVRKGTRTHRGSKLLAHRARYGKAMLQRHTLNTRSIYRPYDLQGIIMPSTDKVERFNKACLAKAGLSGYLGPGVSIRIPG